MSITIEFNEIWAPVIMHALEAAAKSGNYTMTEAAALRLTADDILLARLEDHAATEAATLAR